MATIDPAILSFCLVVFLLLLVDFFSDDSFPPQPTGTYRCSGRLLEERLGAERVRLLLEIDRCDDLPEPPRRVLATIGEGVPQVLPGDQILFQIRFRTPTEFQNPGGFHYLRYLKSEKVDAVGSIANARWISQIQTSPPDMLESVRRRLRFHLHSIADPEVWMLTQALLLGEQGVITPEFYDLFRKTGTAHFLSISGLHIGIIFLLCMLLLRPLVLIWFSTPRSALEWIPAVALLPTWAYIVLAHSPVAAVRAGVMATLFASAALLRLRFSAVSVIFLTAFLLLCWQPLWFFQVGFQLSFVAVLALCWVAGKKNFLAKIFLGSVAVTLATTPILLWHFHEISFLGIVANVILIPLFNLFLMPLFAASFLLSGILDWPAVWLWKWITLVGQGWIWLQRLLEPWAAVVTFRGAIRSYEIVLCFAVFFLWWGGDRFRRPVLVRGLASLLGLFVFIGVVGSPPWEKNKMLQVHFIDVGQGDAAAIRFPTGEAWLIDGGGIRGSDFDIGRFVVAPFLLEQGIRRVDRVLLTHPHHDHYRGLEYILRNFHPKEVWTSGEEAPESETEDWKQFQKALVETGVSVKRVHNRTEPVHVGEVQWNFLLPHSEGPQSHFDPNDNSVVGRLAYGDVSFLFSGDLMEAGEELLLGQGFHPQSTVLKVGHHGSRTSSTLSFLNAVKPKIAVISSGKYNRYGVPDEEVLARLGEGGTQILRTDEVGAISIQTDGKTVTTTTFVSR